MNKGLKMWYRHKWIKHFGRLFAWILRHRIGRLVSMWQAKLHKKVTFLAHLPWQWVLGARGGMKVAYQLIDDPRPGLARGNGSPWASQLWWGNWLEWRVVAWKKGGNGYLTQRWTWEQQDYCKLAVKQESTDQSCLQPSSTWTWNI